MPTLSIRFTKKQYDQLVIDAESSGMTRGSVLKKAYFGRDFTPRRVPRPDQVQLSRILGQAGKIGSNVNQIARKYNTGELAPDMNVIESLEAIKNEIEQIGNSIKEVLNG